MIESASPRRPQRTNPFLWRYHFKHWGGDGRRVNPHAIWSAVLVENCLRPWLLEGDGASFDASLAPRHGDLVLVKMRYGAPQSASLTSVGATPGVITRKSVKQLQIDRDGRRWLVCANGRVEADLHEIVGILIATHRPPFWSLRRWRHPMREAEWPAAIEPHAPIASGSIEQYPPRSSSRPASRSGSGRD